jgi:hypothetical protein
MDLASLTLVLRSALSHSPEERKAAEASLNQVSDHHHSLLSLSLSLSLSLAPLLPLTRQPR